MRWNEFNPKFYGGLLLVVLSLIIGKITQFMFFYYFEDVFLRWFSLIIYIISWPMMVIGIWWVGKEYTEQIRRYADYRFYHESIKNKSRQVYSATKERTKRIHASVKNTVKERMPLAMKRSWRK